MRWTPCFGGALALVLIGAARSDAAAQDTEQSRVACRDLPCAIVVDWTRAGGVSNQQVDRRYGNPTQLEDLLRARLRERGFTMQGGAENRDLRFLLQPNVRNAMCDHMPGTTTDMSCRAIVEINVRVEGPEQVTRGVDLPSRLRNRCSGDEVMPVDKLATFVADWIAYAVEGKAKGEKRPVARC